MLNLKCSSIIFLFLKIKNLSSCRLSDLEAIAYVQGLTKTKQLEYFSLKIIQ